VFTRKYGKYYNTLIFLLKTFKPNLLYEVRSFINPIERMEQLQLQEVKENLQNILSGLRSLHLLNQFSQRLAKVRQTCKVKTPRLFPAVPSKLSLGCLSACHSHI
jgi:hypothetical protein